MSLKKPSNYRYGKQYTCSDGRIVLNRPHATQHEQNLASTDALVDHLTNLLAPMPLSDTLKRTITKRVISELNDLNLLKRKGIVARFKVSKEALDKRITHQRIRII